MLGTAEKPVQVPDQIAVGFWVFCLGLVSSLYLSLFGTRQQNNPVLVREVVTMPLTGT